MEEQKQGGMTGATGNLTPDEPNDEFIPAETREMSDPATARQLTAAAHRRAEARQGGETDEPGRLREMEADTAPNARDGGYGSEKGLAPDDPAYRIEERALPPRDVPAPLDRDPVLGGDERHDPEQEHF
jgi:hypothetical protein